jgi:hypothetical protein
VKRIAFLVVAILVALIVLVWLVGFVRGYLDARSDSAHQTQGPAPVLHS